MKLVIRHFAYMVKIPGSWLLLSSTAHAENLYNAVTGDLVFPVITVDENTSYSGSFTLVSEEPLIWAANVIEPISAESRTAAVYDPATATLWVPEINVQGSLN